MTDRKKRPLRVIDGFYYRIRWSIFFVATLSFLIVPWINWNGRQAILFNFADRIFFIFGLVFLPQNIILLGLWFIILALLMFIVAALGGRLFCGFICPQTHFISAFRAVGRMVDRVGHFGQTGFQRPVSNAITGGLIVLICLVLGYVMTGYFVPIRGLYQNIFSGNIWTIFWFILFSASIWISCAWMQERICRYVCPYARFQGVMIDKDTLIVSYVGRPPEGALSRKDCGRCQLCQVVCPVSIDIRDGAQYPCIGCAACIDACTAVSTVKGFEAPLVQFSSINRSEADHDTHLRDTLFRPRILGYLLMLLILSSVFGWMIYSRPLIKMNILRDRAVLVRIHESRIENLYNCLFINQTEEVQRLELTVMGPTTTTLDSKREITLPPLGSRKMIVTVSVREGSVPPGIHPIDFLVQSSRTGRVFAEERTTFLVSEQN